MIATGPALGGGRHGETKIFGIAPHGHLLGTPIRNGTRKSPSPGFYILGALGSCLVMGIKFMAAQRSIEVRSARIRCGSARNAIPPCEGRRVFHSGSALAGC